MLIISKYKDYYDYLKGIYGEDPLLVLDRTETLAPIIYSGSTTKIVIVFCGFSYEGLHKDGKYYWGDNILKFGELKERKPSRWSWEVHKPIKYYKVPIKDSFGKDDFIEINTLPKPIPEEEQKENCPILIKDGSGSFLKYPKLIDYNFGQIMPPETAWLKLSEWLSKQVSKREITVPIGDDKVRILSHGFDLKTSFRGK